MTKVELVNLSLTKLGASLIVSLGDTSIPESHFGELLYQSTLERILRDFPWSFAEREADLAQLPEKEAVHWAYSYSLPSNFVRFLELMSDTRGIPNGHFHRTGKKVHCDASPARVKYITSDLTPDDFDADFREAFVTLLAAEMATPLLQSPQLAQALSQEYTSKALPKAKTVDARETDAKENHDAFSAIASSPLVNARFRRSGGHY